MLNFTGSMTVHLAIEPVDLRKSFVGLWALAENELKEDPLSGALFVFTNRRHNRVKILYWDGSGLWVLIKRLEQGTFSWPSSGGEEAKMKLRPEALALLLDGVDLRGGKLRPWYQR